MAPFLFAMNMYAHNILRYDENKTLMSYIIFGEPKQK